MRLLFLSTFLLLSFCADEYGYEQDWFSVPLDHFNPQENRNFKLRYWINMKDFDPKNTSAPIFILLCGESICRVPDGRGRAYPHMLAQQHKGLMLILEHRYYGYSQPFGDWELKNLEYLTAENALADIALFLKSINDDLVHRFGGKRRKTIVMGGSYPGALSAWMRYKYPHIVDASLASSAVVKAIDDMWEYD